MGSKKAKRKEAYLKREKKRIAKREANNKYCEIMNNGSMEEIALAVGIKLK